MVRDRFERLTTIGAQIKVTGGASHGEQRAALVDVERMPVHDVVRELLRQSSRFALEAAAADCGLVRENGRRAVLATIKSGLQRGMSNPREVAA